MTDAPGEPVSANSQEKVQAYYTSCVQKEWRRLVRDSYHRLELDTSLFFLEKHLPAGGLILDAGGGPGRYTRELASRGYELVLLDLVPANLAFARRQLKKAGLLRQVKEFYEGSITNLSHFEDGCFDGVVCLGGPLSHILDAEQRERAVNELIRVCRPGGTLACSVIARLSLLTLELVQFQYEIEMPHFKEIRDSGDYQGDSGFTSCHFFLPEELNTAFSGKGVDVLETAGLEGISTHHARQANLLAKDPLRWQIWLETHYQTCTHPAVVGTSEHMLIVCKKR